MMQRITIEVPHTIKKNKTRRFSASLLGYITADLLWEGGKAKTDDHRPVYLAVAGPPTTLNPFLANLKSGRKAILDIDSYGRGKEKIHCLKSTSYETTMTAIGSDAVATMLLPEVFAVEPGMIDPDVCQFLSVPPQWWVDEQLAALTQDREMVSSILSHAAALGLMSDGQQRPIPIPRPQTDEEILSLVPLATHFALCLDRRTRLPIIIDPRFFLQLYVSALDIGFSSVPGNTGYGKFWGKQAWADGFKMVGTEALGFAPGVMFTASHEGGVDLFLAKNVRMYQGVV